MKNGDHSTKPDLAYGCDMPKLKNSVVNNYQTGEINSKLGYKSLSYSSICPIKESKRTKL